MLRSMIIQSINELIKYGYSEAQIAAAVGVSQASINRIKAAKQRPGYTIGVAIIRMRDEKLGAGKTANEPRQEAA